MSAFISILISSILFNCMSPSTKKYTAETQQQEHEQNIIQKAEQVKTTYQKLIDSNYSKDDQKYYFDVFPNSFDLFVSLFGGEDFYKQDLDEEPKPASLDFRPFLQAFFKLSSIDKKIYLKKIIDICVGATFWDPDGVGVFQDGMIKKVKQSFKIFYPILKKHSKEEIKSFWYFYFAGPAPDHPEKVKDLNQLIKKLNILDKEMVPIVRKAYAKVKEENVENY